MIKDDDDGDDDEGSESESEGDSGAGSAIPVGTVPRDDGVELPNPSTTEAIQTAAQKATSGDGQEETTPEDVHRLDEPLYHGTEQSSAEDLVENGINEAMLQQRDRGFFGDGFYKESSASTTGTVARGTSRDYPRGFRLESR